MQKNIEKERYFLVRVCINKFCGYLVLQFFQTCKICVALHNNSTGHVSKVCVLNDELEQSLLLLSLSLSLSLSLTLLFYIVESCYAFPVSVPGFSNSYLSHFTVDQLISQLVQLT